jgi:hypothetical protein
MSLPDQALVEVLRARAYAKQNVRLTPETTLRLAAALHAVIGSDRMPPRQRREPDPGFGFLVEQLDERGQHERVIASAEHVEIGRAAYNAAVEAYPNRRICFRQRSHIIADSERDRGRR